MLSLFYLLAVTNILSSIVTCTPFVHQKLFTAIDIVSKLSIPGGSTFQYCSESDLENDIFSIDRIEWEPNPPKISEKQEFLIYGTFSRRIPISATGTGEIHIPEWHHPYSPASNYTGEESFCAWPSFIYQSDEERGLHKVCDGSEDGPDYPLPEAGPAVLVSQNILFWPLPDGEYWAKLDTLMPDTEDGSRGARIFCFEGSVNLTY